MSFKLISARCEPLTKELAQEQHALEPSPTERALNPSRLRYLKEKAESEHLVTFHWARARIGGRVLRMNGQHSSTMLVELNGAFPEGLTAHVDEYEVETTQDLAVLFQQFDARKSSRSGADVAGAYQGLYPDLADVAKPIAKLAVEGVAWTEKHVEGIRVKLGDEQYDLFNREALHPFIRFMGELYSIKTPEMKRRDVAAAIYATYGVNEAEARTFWHDVARGGAEYDETAPTAVLDAWLKEAKNGDRRRLNLKPANFFQACIYAWNAHREEKPLPRGVRYAVDKGLLEPRG